MTRRQTRAGGAGDRRGGGLHPGTVRHLRRGGRQPGGGERRFCGPERISAGAVSGRGRACRLVAERSIDVSCQLELPEDCRVTARAVCAEEVQGSLTDRGIEVRFPVDFQAAGGSRG